jgi:hypothetical protein
VCVCVFLFIYFNLKKPPRYYSELFESVDIENNKNII